MAVAVPGVSQGNLKRLTAWFVPVVMLASVALATPAEAAGPAVVCGSTLTVDTKLTKDLSCPSGNGLTLGPGVDLNLGGHRLAGPGSSGTGIATTGQGSISIRNGEVKNWGTGVDIDSSEAVASPKVTDVVLRNAPMAIRFGSTLQVSGVTAIDSPVRGELGGNLRITHSRLVRSPVSVFFASATITRSVLVATPVSTSGSGRIAIDRSRLDGRGTARLGDVSETVLSITNSAVKNYRYPISGYYGGATLLNSTFTDMQQGVLADISSGLGSEGTAIVKGNRFVRSGVVLDPHIPMVLAHNTFIENEAGAVFTGSTLPGGEMWAPGKAFKNVLVRNRGTGISSDLPGLVVGRNVARHNAGYGIYAPGAVDSGGNVAYGNTLGQCVGVACSGKK